MTLKKLALVAGAVALVAVIGVLIAGTVSAQTGTPPSQATPLMPKTFMGRGGFGFWGGGSIANFDAVAKALNLTPTQLFEQLHSGKTLAEIATAQGVDLTKVQDAANAAQAQAMKDMIAQAVKDGKMTQAQADWLQQGLNNGYLGKGRAGFGFGHGMRGGMGMRGFGSKGTTPAPAPAPGTSG